MAVGRLERWRDGKQLSSQVFSDLPATGQLGIDSGDGGQWHDITANGDIVLAAPADPDVGGNTAYSGSQRAVFPVRAALRLKTRHGGSVTTWVGNFTSAQLGKITSALTTRSSAIPADCD